MWRLIFEVTQPVNIRAKVWSQTTMQFNETDTASHMLKMLAWFLLACGHHLSSVKSLKDASYFCWFVSSISGRFSFFALTRAMLFITGRHSFPFMDIIQEWMLLDSYRSIICSFTYPEEHCHTTQLHKHFYSCVSMSGAYTGSHEHACLCVSLSMYRDMYAQFGSVAQSCPTLCNHMDCSSLGSSVHGIFQTRILDWVAIPFSRGSSQSRAQTQISHHRQILYLLNHQGSLHIYVCIHMCIYMCVWMLVYMMVVV